MEMFDGTDSGSEQDYLAGEEERTADEYNSEDEMRSAAADRGRDEGAEQREPEDDASFTERESELRLIHAAQLNSRIHIYNASEIRNFATQEWWGLLPRFRGLLLPEVISLVVHAISLALSHPVSRPWMHLQQLQMNGSPCSVNINGKIRSLRISGMLQSGGKRPPTVTGRKEWAVFTTQATSKKFATY